jgi:NADPH:quinone reductase-like Zn-dependent oxidoreductase
MKAVLHVGYGDPAKAVVVGDIETPVPGENQVLVRVIGSSINSGDWRAVYSSPFFIRLISGVRRPRDPAIGGDAAGVVEAIGSGVTDLTAGDEVFGIRSGALAEYVAGENFVRKPANLSFREAGIVPIAGVTALQALTKYGQMQPGERVVVHGAGGGVGTFAVQIAKALGAHVTAVTSTDKVEMVRGLGADRVIDYTRENFTEAKETYDLIVEIGGGRSIRSMRRVLSPAGRIILVGAGRGGAGTLGRVIGGYLRRRLGHPVRFMYAGGPYQEQLATLRELIEGGKVRPVIDKTYPLTQSADAIRYSATERAAGKIAITVA